MLHLYVLLYDVAYRICREIIHDVAMTGAYWIEKLNYGVSQLIAVPGKMSFLDEIDSYMLYEGAYDILHAIQYLRKYDSKYEPPFVLFPFVHRLKNIFEFLSRKVPNEEYDLFQAQRNFLGIVQRFLERYNQFSLEEINRKFDLFEKALQDMVDYYKLYSWKGTIGTSLEKLNRLDEAIHTTTLSALSS